MTEACVADYDPEVDYFPDKVVLGYAERFQVSYYGHYKRPPSQPITSWLPLSNPCLLPK